MSQAVTLEIPESLYRSLVDLAARQGKSAEDLGSTWFAATIERLVNDPLMQLAGSLPADVTDLAERHNHYLAQGLTLESGEQEEQQPG